MVRWLFLTKGFAFIPTLKDGTSRFALRDPKVKMTANDSNDTNYKYDIYIDGKNQYMKKMPNKAEINNLEQFCNGIIYTMATF